MNGHLTEPLIERYREQALPPAELLDAGDHLAGCELCRQRLDDEQRLQAAGQSLRRDLATTGLTHITYEQLALYVGLARLIRGVLGNRNAAAHPAFIREERTWRIRSGNLCS